MTAPLSLHNGQCVPLDWIPMVDSREFAETINRLAMQGSRPVSYFAYRTKESLLIRIAVLCDELRGTLCALQSIVTGELSSLTPDHPSFNLFEREIAEQFGMVFKNHPWPKPVRSIRHQNFYTIDGPEVHEVAVGPVHAGVIEPGHFRFNCHGELVFHLEISLGYQHRGIEQSLIGSSWPRALRLIECAAGDTSVSHAQACTMLHESLTGSSVPAHAQAVWAIGAELERCANHTGDLGALAGDVGYLPTSSYCGRIRGDFLNMTALFCGNRFGRGLVRLSGTGVNVSATEIKELLKRLEHAQGDAESAIELLFDDPSVQARFEGTGILKKADCLALGLVGVAARASGCAHDVRQDMPYGMYRFAHVPAVVGTNGDVHDRALVRYRELQNSMAFIREQASYLPVYVASGVQKNMPCAPDSLAVALTEGWRGQICHTVITDSVGAIARYKIVDPSFYNWIGLGIAMRNQQISDFPLCNKSFNLSYCGFDL